MAMSFSRPDPASPAQVADASFSTGRRGFDQHEVRDFLRMVGAELGRLQERERFLQRELETAKANPDLDAAQLDDAALTRLLGEETARVLNAARESATAIREKAEQSAARIVTEASDEANRMREEAELEASRRRADAANDAEAELSMAKQQGREMVNEARAYRERVLSELARRRELAREQIEQLVQGRDRLIQVFERARLVAVDVVGELQPLGEPDEYVNLQPSTGPVPVMVARADTDDSRGIPRPRTDDAPYDVDDEPADADPGSSAPGGDELVDSPEAPPADGVAGAPADGGPGEADIEAHLGSDRDADADAARPAGSDDGVDGGDGVDPTDAAPADASGEAGVEPIDAPPAEGEAGVEPTDAAPAADGSDLGSTEPGVAGHAVDRAPTGDELTPTADELAPTDEEPAPIDGAPAPTDVDAEVADAPEAVLADEVPDDAARRAAATDDGIEAGSADDADEPRSDVADVGTSDPDDGSVDDVVVDLFARLRAGADERTGSGGAPRGSTVAERVGDDRDAPVIDLDAPATAPAEATGATGTPDVDGEETPFDRRDADLTPLIVAGARKLKRVLADEQNEVLDALRRSDPVRTLDDLLPWANQHTQRYASAIADDLLLAANAGASTVDDERVARLPKAKGRAAVDEASTLLGRRLVEPLRDRLERCVNDGDGDNPAITKKVRSVYREWKTQHIDDQIDDVVRTAHGRGLLGALVADTPVTWTPDPSRRACPDCDDNRLAGAVPAGQPFPTGHVSTPGHPGCCCLLIPAPR